MTKLFTFALLILLSFLNTAFGQTLQYKIIWGKKEVGSIQAIKKGSTYTITADAKFRVILMQHIENYTFCQFNAGKLEKSIATYTVNGKIKEDNTIVQKEGKYHCNNCETQTINQSSISFTTSKLYFHEPAKPGKVFCERFGEYAELTKVEDHVYKLTLPNGNDNFYHYKNGKLVKIAISRALYSMDFILEE